MSHSVLRRSSNFIETHRTKHKVQKQKRQGEAPAFLSVRCITWQRQLEQQLQQLERP